MAGRIRIPPYKPLGIATQAVPGGGYFDIDASAGQFGASPLLRLGLQAAQGAVGVAGAISPYLGSDNEATVKAADTKLGEAERALLFDPQTGYLNLQGQVALQQAPAVLDAYSEAQARTLELAADDDQRRMLQELADKRLASFNEVVERHGAAQRQRWYDQVGDQRIASMRADAALHWNSDALLRRALGTARAEVRERAERKGWDSPLTKAALRRETSRVLVSAIGAAVDRDPERARALRTRYAAVIEDNDRAALDALLAEAQSRERAASASAEILNAAPPDGEQSTPQWRLQQAETIADPAVRVAAIRFLNSATAATEARARALGEQVLARVLTDGLTDQSQISVSEWVALDTARRQAIETRLDHNAAGTEPASNPALVDQLATKMTEAPYEFARRDLLPLIAHLPLPQWQRFRDWQAGLRRDDPATQSEAYAIKRGLQLASEMLSATTTDDEATNIRAGLVEDIDTQRRITGNSPDDFAIREMILRRPLPPPIRVELVQKRFRRGLGSPPTEQDLIGERIERLRRDLQIDPIAKMIPGGGGGGRLSGVPRMPTVAGSKGDGGRLAGRGSATIKSAPSSPGTRISGADGSRAIGARASAPNAPRSKAPKTSSATGTATGRAARAHIGITNFRPFQLGGHHIIPKQVYKSLGLPDKALRIFERATTGPLKLRSHQYDGQHRVYSDVVAGVVNRWIKKKGIVPHNMTENEANELVDFVMNHNDPVIREYLMHLYNSRQ